MMRALKIKNFFRYILSTVGIIFYCEYAVYYLVLVQCSWPTDINMKSEQPVKVMFLADTHLLGKRKGHWLDKLRREWEMGRAFQTAINLHKPEIIFVLGDLFDEGLWSNEADFNSYVKTFKHLFSVPKEIKLYVVVGNHDIGFHYSIQPFLERRFNKAFNTSPVELVSVRNVHFVLVNSMALENDGCFLCYNAELKLKTISKLLKCGETGIGCSKKTLLKGNYSKPILLQHFPLYRTSDKACNEPDSAPTIEKEKLFREGWDCLRRDSSEQILKMLKPRLVFGGHTHHGCYLKHPKNIHEYSLSSFNWRNKYNPSYMLALFTENDYSVATCHMPREYTIVLIYTALAMIWITKIFNIKRYFPFTNAYSWCIRRRCRRPIEMEVTDKGGQPQIAGREGKGKENNINV